MPHFEDHPPLADDQEWAYDWFKGSTYRFRTTPTKLLAVGDWHVWEPQQDGQAPPAIKKWWGIEEYEVEVFEVSQEGYMEWWPVDPHIVTKRKIDGVEHEFNNVVDAGDMAADEVLEYCLDELSLLLKRLPWVKNQDPTLEESPLDKQVGGSHYKDFAIQPIEFITANNLSFPQGSAIKYLCRYKLKGNPRQDLEKAKHFIDIMLNQLDDTENTDDAI